MDNEDDPHLAAKLAKYLEEAKSSYSQILNRLWTSNGAGAAATLTVAGITMKDGHIPPHLFFVPLSIFLIGIVMLVVGDALVLRENALMIRNMEDGKSLLDLPANSIKRPSERAGLSHRSWQTRMAIGSAGALVLGVTSGFLILLCGSL